MPRHLLVLLPLLLAADWPQHLGPTRDGHSPETKLLHEWPKDGPKQIWTANVGVGWSGPVGVGGKVLLHHRVGDDEVLQCWSAADGKDVWKYSVVTGYTDDYFPADDGPRATPAVVGNHVFTLGAEGKLSCVALDDGKRVWDRDLSKDYPFKKGYFGVASSPLVDDERVYINVGSAGAGVVAFDRKSGKEIWKATDDEASYSSPVLATLAGKPALVCFTRAGLLVLEPATGKQQHAMPFRARIQASVNAATPLVSGDRVFLTSSYNTGAILLDAKDNWKPIWKNDESLSSHYNTPVKVGDFLYGVDGRQESGAELRCVEWATGTVRWTKRGFRCASLIAADGLLIAVVETGEIVLFEATEAGSREKGRFAALTKPVRAAPALSDGRLFARDGKKLAAWMMK